MEAERAPRRVDRALPNQNYNNERDGAYVLVSTAPPHTHPRHTLTTFTRTKDERDIAVLTGSGNHAHSLHSASTTSSSSSSSGSSKRPASGNARYGSNTRRNAGPVGLKRLDHLRSFELRGGWRERHRERLKSTVAAQRSDALFYSILRLIEHRHRLIDENNFTLLIREMVHPLLLGS